MVCFMFVVGLCKLFRASLWSEIRKRGGAEMVVSYLRYVLLPLKAVGLNPSLEEVWARGLSHCRAAALRVL